jgi:hypothetical protein
LAVLAASIAAGCGGSGSSSATVVLAGAQRIDAAQLEHWIGVEMAAGGGASRSAARSQALDLLIGWAWTRQQASAEGLRVSAAEAAQQLARSTSGVGLGVEYEWFPGEAGLRRFLGSARVSRQDQLRVVTLGLLAARLASRRVKLAEAGVGRATIAAYYRRHLGEFHVGERRDIRAVMNKDRAKVVQAKREMQQHRPFHEIEERLNTSVEGGLRLGRGRGEQKKQYERDYFAAPPHRLIGPRHEILYYVFEVFAIHRGYQRTLAQVEPAIRRKLAERVAGTTLLTQFERSWRARTRCRSGYVTARCGR